MLPATIDPPTQSVTAIVGVPFTTPPLSGVGFPGPYEIAQAATDAGLATFTGSHDSESWLWRRTALENLTLTALQDLYTSLKLQEVTTAG